LQFNDKQAQFALKPSYLQNGNEEEARKKGILLHWILSQINNKNDLEDALFKGEVKGLYGKDVVHEIRPLLKNIVNHPQLKLYFEEGVKVKNEPELLTPQGEILRPDRVIFFDNEIVVIDYKSGKEHKEMHSNQLQAYANTLYSMGHLNIRKMLVYLEENKVVELN